MATCRSFSKNVQKLNLQPILNIELFKTDTESELGVLGIAIELMQDVGHPWR
jgi:hypothetical protein